MKTHIMLHHSLTQDGATVSWAAIEKFHRRTQGWLDIGYHAGIQCVTNKPSLARCKYQALIGRPAHADGAACRQGDMNRRALHLCFVGNFDLAPPPKAMLERAVLRVIVPWMLDFGISPERIVGHHDYDSMKTCPGTRFDLELVRTMAETQLQGLGVGILTRQ